jgi:hypothetical protein
MDVRMNTKQNRRRSRIEMKRVGILGLALILALAGWAGAQAQEGVGAGAGFKFGVDARALAMGGAFVAVADSYSAPYWNPAGLGLATGTHVGGMNTNKFGLGINFNYVGAALGVGGFRVGGAFLGEMISGIDTFGPDGQPAGTVDDSNLLFIGSAAMPLPMGGLALMFGGSAKYYTHSLAGESGTGFGGDLGLLIAMGPSLMFGATVGDVGGTKITWTTGAVDVVEMAIRVGGAFRMAEPLPLTLSGQYNLDDGSLHMGAELALTQQIALRAGGVLPQGGDFSFTAGAGLALGALSVDAAFVQNAVLGNSLVVSGEFAF